MWSKSIRLPAGLEFSRSKIPKGRRGGFQDDFEGQADKDFFFYKLCFTCNLGECVNRRKQGEIILLAAEVELIPRREIRVREKLRNIYHGDER